MKNSFTEKGISDNFTASHQKEQSNPNLLGFT
uniref:Uncharacterized protein n=1 Tax=Rhizophora mucronata TaxID=61149 RepID=A0A2P2MXT2_RHIMU